MRQFLAFAVRQRLVTSNPFVGLKSSAVGNDKRLYFVTQADFRKVLDEASDSEWKLILVLARFGGLRVSEIFALRWADVCWDKNRILVRSSKTEGHEGGGTRLIPIFSELAPYLLAAHA